MTATTKYRDDGIGATRKEDGTRSGGTISRGRGRGMRRNLPAWMITTTSSNNKSHSHDRGLLDTGPAIPSSNPKMSGHSVLAKEYKQDGMLISPMNDNEQQDPSQPLVDKDEEELKQLALQWTGDFKDTQQNDNNGGFGDDDDDIQDVSFEQMFATRRQKEDELANQRREARKRKLKELAVQQQESVAKMQCQQSDSPLKHPEHKTEIECLHGQVAASSSVMADLSKSSAFVDNVLASSSTTFYDDRDAATRILLGEDNITVTGVNTVDGNVSFDMFSSSVSPISSSNNNNNLPNQSTKTLEKVAVTTAAASGMDDAEGYYRATIGEIIQFSFNGGSDADASTGSRDTRLCFRVSGIIGKGVFSTVLKCVRLTGGGDTTSSSSSSSTPKDTGVLEGSNDDNMMMSSSDAHPQQRQQMQQQQQQQHVVAIKLIRSYETMAKAAQKEVRILRLLHANSNRHNQNQREENHNGNKVSLREKHIVKLLEPGDYGEPYQSSLSSFTLLEYHNHTALLFEYMPFNLRETLSKFGKNVGINLSAVRSYAKQLLTALQHLEAHRVVHADIKLDNILVSSDFSTVKLCDFGSAFFETDADNDPTPYLVSRFYRAPEIILGMEYDKKIDLWSVAVSLAELFTGRVLFPGINNNDMLSKFMESIGPFSNKMIRRHIHSFIQLGLDPHFEASVAGGSHYNFKRQELDKVSGQPVIRFVSAVSCAVPSKQITHVLLRSRSPSDGRADVILFGEFLGRCLALDPQKRPSIDELLCHGFFTGTKKETMGKMPDK